MRATTARPTLTRSLAGTRSSGAWRARGGAAQVRAAAPERSAATRSAPIGSRDSTDEPAIVDRAASSLVAGALAALIAAEPASMVASSIAAAAASLADPAPAAAALSNPNTRLPRNGVAALRRAVPAVNPEAGAIQGKLEEAAYLLRIPQRKPWGTMSDDVKASLAIARDQRSTLLEPVPAGDARAAAVAVLDEIEQLLVELGPIAGVQDVERFDTGVAMALDAVSRLRVLQAPGLPFDLPRRYDALPRLTGRAAVDVVVRKAPGGTFGFVNGEEQNTVTLKVVVDGYNAPLTSGNFVNNVKRGRYNGKTLKKSETALLVQGAEGGRVDALPLEVKPLDDYEPRYRSPLNVMGAEELPTLPLSVNGALAMARGAEDGTSSASQFFVYQFDKRSAGLGGLAFEEGEFSVFGYVVGGEDEGFLGQLQTGDTIVSAKVTSGLDRLVNGDPDAPDAADEDETR